MSATPPAEHRHMRSRCTRILILAALCSLPLLARAQYTPGLVQVHLADGVSIRSVNLQYGTSVADSLPPLYLLNLQPGSDEMAVVAQMSADSNFVCAEYAYLDETPEGVRQMVVAAVGGTITDYLDQDVVQRIHLPELQAHTLGENVVVAVLDTGIQAAHPALAGAISAEGYDFVDGDTDPSDSADGQDEDRDGQMDEGAGHGTMVAGIIHLVAPAAQILPIRVLDDEGIGSTFAVAKGIRYAVEHGADIISMSFGLTDRSGVIARELASAWQNSVVMVAAAGNLGVEIPQYYPASDPKVFMVAALDSSDVKTAFSNYHVKVLVSAPGKGIMAPFHDGGYAIGAGTSFAAPFISGQCALLKALYPNMSQDVLTGVVRQGVVDVYQIPENDPYWPKLGSGRFDGSQTWAAGQAAAVEEPIAGPSVGRLVVSPNPAPPGAVISIRLRQEQRFAAERLQSCSIMSPLGRLVRALPAPGAGAAHLDWDTRDGAGRPVVAGIYWIRANLADPDVGGAAGTGFPENPLGRVLIVR
jgi:subtilisin family serine protease